MTPAGIEPATVRFGAQRFNHCATAWEVFYISKKFHWHHLGSSQVPSYLWHSTLTTVLPRYPNSSLRVLVKIMKIDLSLCLCLVRLSDRVEKKKLGFLLDGFP